VKHNIILCFVRDLTFRPSHTVFEITSTKSATRSVCQSVVPVTPETLKLSLGILSGWEPLRLDDDMIH